MPEPETPNHAPAGASKCLHFPPRRNALLSVERHVAEAAALSRALWLLLSFDSPNDVCGNDERNKDALVALAHAIADHASAAEFLLSAGDDEHVRKMRGRIAHILADGAPEEGR